MNKYIACITYLLYIQARKYSRHPFLANYKYYVICMKINRCITIIFCRGHKIIFYTYKKLLFLWSLRLHSCPRFMCTSTAASQLYVHYLSLYVTAFKTDLSGTAFECYGDNEVFPTIAEKTEKNCTQEVHGKANFISNNSLL
jgi:hypothetical protein